MLNCPLNLLNLMYLDYSSTFDIRGFYLGFHGEIIISRDRFNLLRRIVDWLLGSKSSIPTNRVFIKGERVILREKNIKDLSDDYCWRTNSELSKLDATTPIYISFEDFSRQFHEEIFYGSLASKRLSIDNKTKKHIGNCMFYSFDSYRRQAELGIMIGDRNYWSKGYGTETVKLMLNYIFTETNLNRIYLHTLKWNERARKSFSKCGFTEANEIKKGGYDFILMEILKKTWENQTTIESVP